MKNGYDTYVCMYVCMYMNEIDDTMRDGRSLFRLSYLKEEEKKKKKKVFLK